VANDACPTCGRPIDQHNRHVRLILPDPVLAVPVEEREARTWGQDPLIQVQGVGAFVRVLLPIRLTGGFTLTVGTWLAIDPAQIRSVWEEWETNSYATLELDGYLANGIPPWGESVLAAPAHAAVEEPSHNPYVQSSTHPVLSDVLAGEWPHGEVLEAYRSVL
jgi:hypothetical protein